MTDENIFKIFLLPNIILLIIIFVQLKKFFFFLKLNFMNYVTFEIKEQYKNYRK